MTSLHFTRPLETYMGVLGSGSASTGGLSPSRGFRAALSSLRDLRASPSSGGCRE
jgi:hypothetical protein